jgi:hypothetical protein
VRYSTGSPPQRRRTRLERISTALKLTASPKSPEVDATSTMSAEQRKLKKKRRRSAAPLSPSQDVPEEPPSSPEVAIDAAKRNRRLSFTFLRKRSSATVKSPIVPSSPSLAMTPADAVTSPTHETRAHLPLTSLRPVVFQEPVPAARESFLPRSYSVPAMPAHFARSAPNSEGHDVSGPSSEYAFSEDDGPSFNRRASHRWSRELSSFMGLEDDLAFQEAVQGLYDEPAALLEEPEATRPSVASFDTKACFVVRELLASEKSYLKHLNNLDTVRCMLTSVSADTGFRQSLAFTASMPPLPRSPVSYMSDTDLPYLAAQRPKSLHMPSQARVKNEHVGLLRQHLPPIMGITDLLIRRWVDDPSPVAVALTFLEYEEHLKLVYSNWVVHLPRLLQSVREACLPPSVSPNGTLLVRSRNMLKRHSIAESSDTDVEQMTPRPSLTPQPSLPERRKSWVSTMGARKRKESVRLSTSSGKLTIQDIVIMPSQRVTRYELFLKYVACSI